MIRDLKSEDYVLAGDIITRAFHDDPVNLWTFRNTDAMRAVFTELARSLYLAKGWGQVTAGEEALTLWLPAGLSKDVPVTSTLRMGMGILRHGGVGSLVNALKIDAMLGGHRPSAPHLYLFAIGTVPEWQGKGFGAQLMRAGLERADADGLPCYLESSKPSNIPFYRHFGFEVTGELRVNADAPPLFPMWRAAR